MPVKSPALASGTAVRFALLALLAQGATHGYELKLRFERSTGGLWPLNVGQVYDALRRLERDGRVKPAPDVDDERRPYALTRRGRNEGPTTKLVVAELEMDLLSRSVKRALPMVHALN